MLGLGRLTALSAAEHMALDEALLDRAPESPVLRFYDWAAPAVTFGYSQSFEFARRCAEERGLGEAELVRRATGGGVVFHDGDLTFSLVFGWDRLSSPCFIYKNIHRGAHLGLKAIGVKTALKAGPVKDAIPALDKACFAAEPEAMDLLNEAGEKVLGGALRRRGTRGLYQGSFRLDRIGRPREEILAALRDGLSLEFRGLSAAMPQGVPDLAKTLISKYTSERWNRRR